MNQLAILWIICGLIISGCGEAVDSTYRESSETQNVPTLHLVLDSESSSESLASSCIGMVRSVEMDCHVQSNRPIERDTYVLVNVKEGSIRKVGEVEDIDCTNWGRCERVKFVAILAGETQSKRLSLSIREWDRHSKVEPRVVLALPPAHERATLLPRKISYIGAMGQKVEKELLVEYPFNPYNVGSPTEIRVQWQGNNEDNGINQHNESSEVHDKNEINRLLKVFATSYETEDVDLYISVFWADGFRYVSDMGTPNNTTDDVRFDDIREERESAIRVFSLYRKLQIDLTIPLEVEWNESRTRAEVRTHYEITAFVADGVSLEGGHDGWYAEGVFLFVLEKRPDWRRCVWRITEWFDKASHKERLDKLATAFGNVKAQ